MAASDRSRVILHVDLDYFFAQCEERETPSYKGRPVVVCVYSARGGDSGAVSTANYVARRYGVKSGMPIALAKRLLKDRDGVFLPVNKKFYRRVSREIMAILRRHADSIEQVSVDEAYLDVTRRVDRDFDQGREVARAIKEEILAKERLTCSVGVGPNKLVAKIAAGFSKPDGLTVVTPEEVRTFLNPLPARELHGVGRKTERALLERGVKTIGDLAKYPVERLVEDFGKTFGVYLHNAANGVDDTPVRKRGSSEQISRMTTLKENTRDVSAILEDVYRLCDEMHEAVLDRNLTFRSVSILAFMEDFSVRSRSRTLETATRGLEVMKTLSRGLVENLLAGTKLRVRRVGGKVSKLEEAGRQPTLKEFLDAKKV